ncbi:uncharacterized protein LOC128961596 [Oppia nitens]|uniref:uncharacterized protein LOC128961596 n=1 Tax=Oppia nitens TaxID=1686743 RepID=UPI0023DB5245|nr:uncharacterized protein LOC128961596 [Oppia nitens]
MIISYQTILCRTYIMVKAMLSSVKFVWILLFVCSTYVVTNCTPLSKCMAFVQSPGINGKAIASQSNEMNVIKKAMDNSLANNLRACLLNEEGFRFKKGVKLTKITPLLTVSRLKNYLLD